MDKNCISNVSFIHGIIGRPTHGILKLENDMISLLEADTKQLVFNEPIKNVNKVTVMKKLNFKIVFKDKKRFVISGVDWGDKKFLRTYYLKLVIPFAIGISLLGYFGYKARTSSNIIYALIVLIPVVGSLVFRKFIQSTDGFPTATADGVAQNNVSQFTLDKDVVDRWEAIFSSYNVPTETKSY